MANSFGTIFKITTFGESHGGAVGVVIDGCPAGHKIDLDLVQAQLDRRRPGQSQLASPRDEKDRVSCLSGMVNNVTLGTPLTLVVYNEDFRSDDYNDLAKVYRPSHADYTVDAKYGVQAPSGGGRASARETIGRVAAGAVADQILAALLPCYRNVAWVESVQSIKAAVPHPELLGRNEVDQHPTRCPILGTAQQMEQLILQTKKDGDSLGGVIFGGVSGIPAGLGEPVFDKLEADLAKAMLSLPATKGFEVGMGFASTQLFGSQHNDAFVNQSGSIRTATNRSGGIQGGISNGEFIYFRVAFKPVATIFKPQQSVNRQGEELLVQPKAGRHDPCVLPRAVPMVEAMASLVLIDHFLRQLPVDKARGPHSL